MFNSITRYLADDLIIYKDKKMYEIREPVDTTLKDDDEYYTVNRGDTLRSIANTLYQDARLW